MTPKIAIISPEFEDKLKLESLAPEITTILVIGLGASVLNSRAIFACTKVSRKIIFLDSIEKNVIDDVLLGLTQSNTCVVSISKSGKTDETILILKYVLNRLKNANTYLVSEDEQSILVKTGYQLSSNAKFFQYEKSLSGRFSVLLNSSLLPIHLAGGDISFISEQARNYENQVEAKALADMLLDHYAKGRNIIVLSVYDSNLIGFAEWLRQIIAESLGKNNFGLTTLISRGTIDEHSQLQLYLDGPDDKIYYLLPSNADSNHELGLALNKHMNGFNKALEKALRPCVFEQEFSTRTICKWLLAVQYIAISQKIDPFTQPAVDEAKKLFI